MTILESIKHLDGITACAWIILLSLLCVGTLRLFCLLLKLLRKAQE